MDGCAFPYSKEKREGAATLQGPDWEGRSNGRGSGLIWTGERGAGREEEKEARADHYRNPRDYDCQVRRGGERGGGGGKSERRSCS